MSFKTAKITLVFDRSKNKILFDLNQLIKDDQVMVGQLKDQQDEEMKDIKIDNNSNNLEGIDEKKTIDIKFNKEKADHEIDEKTIDFK